MSSEMTDDQIKATLRAMPADWAFRWCDAGLCACMGCANNSGRLGYVGKERWRRCLQEMAAGGPEWSPEDIKRLEAALRGMYEPVPKLP